MFDEQAAQREDKLILLCALSKLGACTQEQLMRFVVETQMQGQFSFLLALADLRESALVREVKRIEGRLLVLTPEGRQSVELFGSSIRASLQEKLQANAPAWRERFREELLMPTDWVETDDGFTVTLRTIESGQEIFSMTLTAATRDQARRFCERWPCRGPALYRTIMHTLGEEDEPDAAP